MRRFRSICLRQIVLQVLFIGVLWGAFSCYFLTILHDRAYQTLDKQLTIISHGVAGLYDKQAIDHDVIPRLMSQIDIIFREVMNLDEEAGFIYHPMFQIVDRQGILAYRSPNAPATPLLQTPTHAAQITHQGEIWHAVAIESNSERWLVIAAESEHDRELLIGSPNDVLFILIIFLLFSLLMTWASLHWGLRPLRLTAREIDARQPGDFTPMQIGIDYSETRPLVNGINQLMSRLEQNIRREKQLLGDAAHELRTPIAAVLAQLHLLELATQPQERRAVIAEMHQGLERAASLSRQLIAIARLEADDFTLHPSPQDLVARVTDCITLYYPLALSHGIQIAYHGPEQWPCRLDPQALTSILNNLIENSIKYGQRGGHILLSLQIEVEQARLQVRDDGPGIPSEHKTRIFERFYRVPGMEATGSGLGLAIAHALAERMGGTLGLCAGLKHRGIGFELRLPCESATGEKQIKS